SFILSHSHDVQHFSGVNRRRFVEHCMLNCDQQLIIPASETSGQWMIAALHYHSFPHHIPELFLRYPIFLAVVAYDQGCFFDFHICPTVIEFSRSAFAQFFPTKSDQVELATSKALCHGDWSTARRESGMEDRGSKIDYPPSMIFYPRSSIFCANQ